MLTIYIYNIYTTYIFNSTMINMNERYHDNIVVINGNSSVDR